MGGGTDKHSSVPAGPIKSREKQTATEKKRKDEHKI